MLFLTTLLISIILTVVLMPYARMLALKLQAVDTPGSRKIHESLMPRCGGMAMAVGAMTPIILWAPMVPFTKGLLLGTLIIVLFGVADDIKDLNPNTKLGGQVGAALVAVLVGGVKITDLGSFLPTGVILPDWAAIPLTIFVIVGCTNATNLSDGLDGLAGGIALLIFIGIGYLSAGEENWLFVLVSIAIGGSVLGFLRFNTHPAQLFMGDAGSQLLGFVAILLSITLTQQNAHYSPIMPLILLGMPILDTLTVMIKRLVSGHSPFVADKTHFHHRLIAMGLFHTEAVLTIYVIQAALIVYVVVNPGLNDWIFLASYLIFAGALVGSFHFVSLTGYHINRDTFLTPLKARLKPLKDRGQVIRVSFGIVKYGVPLLLLFNTLFPTPENEYRLLFSAGSLGLLFLAWILGKYSLGRAVKFFLYLLTPFLIYRCDQSVYLHMTPVLIMLYNLTYLILLVSVLMTMKLTRRTHGFKSSPLDFLIIFVILLIPNLPDTVFSDYRLGLVAAKTVILFYSYEVLIGELRKKSFVLPLSVAGILLSLKVLVLYAR
ncbi:MAG: undecaprenyl/decaprenyl-phosphate alpha-N-acetylglucosaminyl 1-phosphate transferase [Deltaproteobacteria bacterium]|nr:undecaprenyl/decaprenyl-phosphate alpha-N-acetylglucosaminyl 1-phosphate transferase [Deltaproteobacteria bacterium]